MNPTRVRICLNGIWEIAEEGGAGGPPSDNWRACRVPEEYGDWSRASAWYRLRLRIPQEAADARMVIEIRRVRFHGILFMNGVCAGESWQPRVPLVADVTDCANPGEENEITVFVHSLAQGHSNPGNPLATEGQRGALLDYYDTHDVAAIMGDVHLSVRPQVAVTDVQIMPSVRKSELRVRARLSNDSEKGLDAELRCRVLLGAEAVLDLRGGRVELPASRTREVELSAKWPDPELWGTPPFGQPVLYQLESSLWAGGKMIDRRYDRFGFRELWVEGERLVLNGRPVFMMGTHASGFEMREAMTLLVPKLQQAGFLFVHAHSDNRLESFYDVCDELGMMVWDGTYCGGPIGNSLARWGRSEYDDNLRAALPYLTETWRRWVRLNRNHPSVVMWSAGCNCECIHEELADAIESEDPTRPVVVYYEPRNEREVRMFGFPGWEGEQIDYFKGREAIQKACSDRGERHYPLWIGEYWSQSGRPEAMRITWELGVSGGCTFDVGQWWGSLPNFHTEFKISWPSQSGAGQKRKSLLLRGHRATYPERRHVNWCDKSKPVFDGEWAEETDYRRVSRAANGEIDVAKRRAPEVIITVTRAGLLAGGQLVLVEPANGHPGNPIGVMADGEGKAWFVLPESGRYRARCDGMETEFEADWQPLELTPGYDYVQRVQICGRPGIRS